MMKKHTGRGACGAIEFTFDTQPSFIASCHCLDCGRASGGTTATFFGVPQEDFTLVRGTPRAFGYVSEAGKKLERNFCPECGARPFTSDPRAFPVSYGAVTTLDPRVGVSLSGQYSSHY